MAAKTDDVLVFRDVSAGEWHTKLIAAHRLQAHLDGGWTVLIRAADVRDQAIADTYTLDQVQWENRRRERR